MRRAFCGLVLAAFVLSSTAGCVDDRVKRAAAVNNAKVRTAKKEFNAAKTPEEKVKVAEEFFRNEDGFSQAFEDYCFGRQPKTVAVPVPDEKPK